MIQKTELVSSVSETFRRYFLSQNFKVKNTSEVFIAIQKKSVVELWLPQIDDTLNTPYILFRLSLDLKAVRDYLVILNISEKDKFSFKLVQQLKMNGRGNYDYPQFQSFDELLNVAIHESSHQNNYVENETFQNDYFEESITVLNPSAVY